MRNEYLDLYSCSFVRKMKMKPGEVIQLIVPCHLLVDQGALTMDPEVVNV